MATFPEDPIPSFPLNIEPEWITLVRQVDTGGEQRKQKSLFPKYNVTVQYDVLTQSEMQTLWDFYQARKGAYDAFYIFDLVAMNHDGQYAGTGDGATEIFDIPGRSTSAQSVYLDGLLQTLTTDYVILTGGGESNADRIDFVSPPTAGAIVTVDFTGYLRMRVRFLNDKLPRELFSVLLFRYGIELKGLKAA